MSKQNQSVQQASFSSPEAAAYLGVSDSSLEKSRITGQLFGTTAPNYRRAGRCVRYLRADLDAWLATLPEYRHTGEEIAERAKAPEPCR